VPEIAKTIKPPPAGGALASAGPQPSVGGFDEVYREHCAFVWRNVLSRGIPRSSVEDVVQEVFVVVHRKLPEFEGRAQLRTWLAMVVRRVVAGHLRRKRNKPTGEPLEGDAVSGSQGPAEALDTKLAVSAFHKILERMREDQREVFVLHDLEQMTGREIAEITGMNENTVHTRLRAARRIFQEGVAQLNDEGER
jgi:RNA polymerase sigma-70 factor, ECF subfamily